MIRLFCAAALFSMLIVSASAAPEVASAVSQPQVQSAVAGPRPDTLSRRPASPANSAAAKPQAPKATPAPKPVEPTPDVEIWLGEGIGRFGDYEFSVLGGRPEYPTPTGAFKIEWKSRSWWSRQWNAEMPYSCFFSGGAAIHEGSLRTRSHGCIHVSREAARKIYLAGREKVTRVFVYP